MVFSDTVVIEAWSRSRGVCECSRKKHNHMGLGGGCTQNLDWAKRGKRNEVDGWEPHHKVSVDSGGSDVLSNCELLCSWCHKETKTFGG